jgi:hypothetical protein
VALLFFSPFIVTGSLWGICRLRYRKRFEFRLKTRELHVEERTWRGSSTPERVPFAAVHIETRYDEMRFSRRYVQGYFSLVQYGRKPLATYFAYSHAEADAASDELSRATGIPKRREARTPAFKRDDVVRVCSLQGHVCRRSFAPSERLPAVGDVGKVRDVLCRHKPPDWFLVEAVEPDGATRWLAEFPAEGLEGSQTRS